MPHEHDDFAKYVVTPFGQTGVVQSGVTIKPFQRLRDHLMPPADSSDLDLNPEEYAGHSLGKLLRRRLRGK